MTLDFSSFVVWYTAGCGRQRLFVPWKWRLPAVTCTVCFGHGRGDGQGKHTLVGDFVYMCVFCFFGGGYLLGSSPMPREGGLSIRPTEKVAPKLNGEIVVRFASLDLSVKAPWISG